MKKKIYGGLTALAIGATLALGGASPANAYSTTQNRVVVGPGYTVYTCYVKYNWFEKIVQGKVDGPASGSICWK